MTDNAEISSSKEALVNSESADSPSDAAVAVDAALPDKSISAIDAQAKEEANSVEIGAKSSSTPLRGSNLVSKEKPAKVKEAAKTSAWVLPDPKTEEELREAIAAVKGNKNLPRPPYPKLPKMDIKTPVKKRLRQIQKYISALQYNHTGKRYFSVRKDRGMFKLTDTAKKIMTNSLPIQCLEAVFLASFLTADLADVERIPISFKSKVAGFSRNFRHIVMAVRHNGKWGALGLSRKNTLMDKDLVYESLSMLIRDYQQSYAGAWHTLIKIYVGFPFSHEVFSSAPIKWRVLRLRVDTHPWDMLAPVIDNFAQNIKTLRNHFTATGRLPSSFKSRLKFRNGGMKDQDSSGNEDEKPGKSHEDSPHAGRFKTKPKVPKTSPKRTKTKPQKKKNTAESTSNSASKSSETKASNESQSGVTEDAPQRQMAAIDEVGGATEAIDIGYDPSPHASLRPLDYPDSEFCEDSGTDMECVHEDSDHLPDGVEAPSTLNVSEAQIQHSFLGV